MKILLIIAAGIVVVLVGIAFLGMLCINKAWGNILGETGRDE